LARRGPAYPGVGGDAVDIRAAQKLAWQNKLAKGFNTTDVPLEFCLLSGELAEAFDAWRKRRQDVAEELADTAIFLLGLAEMIGADLQEAVEAKLATNEARVYRRLPNGVLVKDAAANQRSARPLG
jgi:NTP pyrophosphatase (non-canonical NTP hydrolase)